MLSISKYALPITIAGAACALILFPQNVFSQSGGSAKSQKLPNIDVRINGSTTVTSLAGKSATQLQSTARTQKSAIAKGINRLKKKVAGAEVTFSPMTAAVEVVRGGRPLTAAAPGKSGSDIVRSFISDNSELYGLTAAEMSQLHFIGESVSQGSGLRMVRVEQMVNGRPIFQSETRFTMDRDGRIARSVGLMIPNASAAAAPLAGLIPATEALRSAMASVNISVNPAGMSLTNTAADGHKTEITANDSAISGNIHSEVVYFPIAAGVLVPAWSQVTFTSGSGDWYTIVDARTGTLLWRKNIRANSSSQDARFRVYVQADGKTPADSPSPLSPTTAAIGSGTQPPAISPTIVSMFIAQNPVASLNGWIDDCPGGVCTAAQTQTIGNNVHAYMDAQAGANNNQPDTNPAFVIDGNGKPTGNPDANSRNRDFLGTTPRDFQTGFLPPPQAGDPEAGQTATGDGNNGTTAIDSFRRGMLTQLFYVANWYHDQLYVLGFDEAAGNFQQTNFSGMGLGGDRVLAEGQDNTSTDNANFSTPPDGQSGRAQMYRFIGPDIDRDGALDSEVLVHELTHGTSNRLVGNGAGLTWNPGGGMGEGWSDFYALSLLNNTNADDPNGKYATGGYATYKLVVGYTDNYVYGIRRFPYSTDNTINPLTWADVDDVTNNLSGGMAPDPIDFNNGGAFEVHNIGEVWCLSLWEVRSRVIADPAGANGDVPTGNHTMLQLVTDALKMTPINPTFTDARDALLDADAATNASANEQSIWNGFADRGLGYKATASVGFGGAYVSDHMGVRESFSVPFLDVVNAATDVTIDDTADNNNGAIDPGEAIKMTVKLTNPWRNASKAVTSATATLSTTNPHVTIYDNSSSYGAIPAQGSANGDTFLFTVSPSAAAGESLNFTMTTVSNLGTTSTDFTLRVGTRSGTDPLITYTSNFSPSLTIVSNQPRGVFNTITITDDFEIADIDFRVDSATHPSVGDLSFMLRAPNGYGVDLIALIDGLNDLGGTSIVNMVIDDDVAALSTNDMVQATTASAPYTKSWLPVYNSPWASLVDPTAPDDPVGELSRLDGASTKGAWSTLVADNYSANNGGTNGNGTFNGWSLLITPVHFDTTAFAAAVNVSGTQTVAGTFSPGGTVTYTVVLTNSGTGAQLDNPGDEFTETLPATLTLVSATSTTGTATPTVGTNTVTWDGGLAPLGGSVTITITATINAGATGQISSQGTINYDANVDGTNEASTTTDDPSVGGSNDPTVFTVVVAPTGSLGDRVWSDGNSNGVQDSGEPGINGVTVELLDSGSTVLTNTTTSGDGNYTFSNLAAGTYTVRVVAATLPAGATPTYDLDGTATPHQASVTISTGQNRTDVDFGYSVNPSNASLGDRVWSDGNSNGVQDSGEPGINGVTVQLLDSGSTVIATTTTSGDGNYTFSGLAAGTYTVRVQASSGATPTYDLDGTATPNQASITVSTGQNRTDVDFGYRLNATPAPTPPNGRQFLNISSRAKVESGDNVMIGGFIIHGNGPTQGFGNDQSAQSPPTKRVLIRGKGPSLPVNGVKLSDPVLTLYRNGTPIATNDNWRDSQQAEIQATGFAPSNDNEAAIVATLNINTNYTAILQPKSGTNSGIGLIEIYDLDSLGAAQMVNLSTRAFISTGDNILIGGLVVSKGPNIIRVLFRATGPSMQAQGGGVSAGTLSDPQLDVYDAQGNHIGYNNNWRDSQQAQIQATGLAPKDSRESAFLFTPNPGNYTAIVSGVNGTTGIGLIEAYRLSP